MAVVVPEESFTEVDFKKNTLIFRPFIQEIKFLHFEEADPPLQIDLSYGIRSVKKILWFTSFLNENNGVPILVLRPVGDSNLDGEFFFEIPDFPVSGYARIFGIPRILEKNITAINAQVFSDFRVQVSGPRFFKVISEMTACSVKIESVETKIVDPEWDLSLLKLNAEVLFSKDN